MTKRLQLRLEALATILASGKLTTEQFCMLAREVSKMIERVEKQR